MSTPNTTTIAGNLTADPEFRLTSNETPHARMRLAVSHRYYNTDTKTWEDHHDGFFTVVCWRRMARHAFASLKKGDRIVVTGRLSQREFEVKSEDSESSRTRAVTEIEADEIGASMRWHSWARLEKRTVTEVEDASTGTGTASAVDAASAIQDDDDAVVAPAA